MRREDRIHRLAARPPRPWWAECLLYVFWYLPGYCLCVLVLHILSRTRIRDRDLVPRKGGVLFLANHASNLDPWILGHALFPRPMWFPAKAELFDVPMVRSMIRGWRAFPVHRGRGDDQERDRIAALARRYYVCLFPEGTRSRDGRLGRARRGAIRVLLRARTTVVPVHLEGTAELLPVGARLPRVGKRLSIRFGEAISPEELTGIEETDEDLDRLGEQVMERIRNLAGSCAGS